MNNDIATSSMVNILSNSTLQCQLVIQLITDEVKRYVKFLNLKSTVKSSYVLYITY